MAFSVEIVNGKIYVIGGNGLTPGEAYAEVFVLII